MVLHDTSVCRRRVAVPAHTPHSCDLLAASTYFQISGGEKDQELRKGKEKSSMIS